MTIGEAAELSGISVDNLRYYERIGLIPEVPRTASGIREYDEVSLNWINFAMWFKRGGLSLEAIREYIQLALQGETTIDARKQILLEAKKDIEKKMTELQESLDVVSYKLDTYNQKCEAVTMEIVQAWKDRQKNSETKS